MHVCPHCLCLIISLLHVFFLVFTGIDRTQDNMICLIKSSLPVVRSRTQCFAPMLTRQNLLCTTTHNDHCRLIKHGKQYQQKSQTGAHSKYFHSHSHKRTFTRCYATSVHQSSTKCLVGERDRFNAIMVDLSQEENHQYLVDDKQFGAVLTGNV